MKKKTYKLGENISKWCDWQGPNFQNIQTAYTIQQQKKNKQPIWKMSRRPLDSPPKKIYSWPRGIWKDVNY